MIGNGVIIVIIMLCCCVTTGVYVWSYQTEKHKREAQQQVKEMTLYMAELNPYLMAPKQLVILFNPYNTEEEKKARRIFASVVCHKMWVYPMSIGGENYALFKDGGRVELRPIGDSKREKGDLFFIVEGSAAASVLNFQEDNIWLM